MYIGSFEQNICTQTRSATVTVCVAVCADLSAQPDEVPNNDKASCIEPILGKCSAICAGSIIKQDKESVP
ncbi:MAG: hypothetical protein PHV32_00145 [Eubacteriales bacterium]|nr:hypothetical protein [Eubacteriales bacterium]